MYDPIRRPLTVALVGFALACSRSAPGEPTLAPIQTDSYAYTVRYTEQLAELTIGVRYVNRTGGRVFLPGCKGPDPPVLEKRVGAAWVTAYSPIVLLCLGPPLVIRPGGSYEFTYRVVAGRAGTKGSPKFDVPEIPGIYRLVWGVLGSWDPDGHSRVLPLEQRVSNEFQIRE